jgi:protein TonB
MKKIILVAVVVSGSFVGMQAQITPTVGEVAATNTTTEKKIAVVDPNAPQTYPYYSGGSKQMKSFMKRHLSYPQGESASGSVLLSFLVKADGSLTDIKVLNGLSPVLDQTAVDLVKKMPKWKPARKDGANVDCTVTLPVAFEHKNE